MCTTGHSIDRHPTQAVTELSVTVALLGRGWAVGSTPLQTFKITQTSPCLVLAGEHPAFSLLGGTFFWARSYEVTLLSVSASNKFRDVAAEERRLTTTDLILQYKSNSE